MAFGLNGEVIQALRPVVYNTPLSAVTGSDVLSVVFKGTTRIIRVYAVEDVRVQFGSSPVTTADSMFIPGGVVEFIRVQPGEQMAVRADSTNGTFYYTEMD